MRAEAQAYADKINDALALLRRFIDWDKALRRLDELNARVEDPTLWENPKAAQEVMRERRRLDESITATRAIERELADTSELIEMAEAEGDVVAGRMPDHPVCLVSDPTVFDPSREVNGLRPLWTYCHVPFDCPIDPADYIIRQLERFAPKDDQPKRVLFFSELALRLN